MGAVLRKEARESAWGTLLVLVFGCLFLSVAYGMKLALAVYFIVWAICGEIQRKANQIIDAIEEQKK